MDTLDKMPTVREITQNSKIVATALKMMQDFEPIRSEKDNRIRKAKDLYLLTTNGITSDRRNKMPSFILNQLTEIYATFIKVPDYQLLAVGISKDTLAILSMYLETILHEGGFNELMTRDWSGYHQQALFGDFFVQCGYKTDGKIGMPEFRGLSVGSFYTNSQASKIRSKTSGQSSTRIGVVFTYGIQELMNIPFFKGVEKIAKPGDLPSLNQFQNETDEKTDIQKGQNIDYYQVMYYYDEIHKTTAAIVGSNGIEWKPQTGEDYPFTFEVNGKLAAQLPLAHFTLFPTPEGIFATGLGEMFMRVATNLTELESGVMNTAIDNKNATAIVNIPNVDAGDLFGQLGDANKQKADTGDNTFIVPVGLDGQQSSVGQGNLSYLKNETNIEEASQIKAGMRGEARTFGFNLDSFFNQQDTARQSELDIIGQNQTISKFQGQNTEDYRFIAQFAMHAIRENGDEEDEEVFGLDMKLDDGTEVSELGITVGQIVKAFKDIKNLSVEVDTKNGFVTNPLLEERTLQKLLQLTQPGTPAYEEYIEAFARTKGRTTKGKDFAAPEQPGQPGQPGQPQQPQQPQQPMDMAGILQGQLNEV